MLALHIPHIVDDKDGPLREVKRSCYRCNNKMQRGDGCPLKGMLKEGDRNTAHCFVLEVSCSEADMWWCNDFSLQKPLLTNRPGNSESGVRMSDGFLPNYVSRSSKCSFIHHHHFFFFLSKHICSQLFCGCNKSKHKQKKTFLEFHFIFADLLTVPIQSVAMLHVSLFSFFPNNRS